MIMARKTKPETEVATEPATVDYAALAAAATTADLPARTRSAGPSKWLDNPFVTPLQNTLDSGKGGAITTPRATAGEIVSGLRDAALKLGVGVRIVYVTTAGHKSKLADVPEHLDGVAVDPISVLFQGQTRRVRRTKTQVAEDASDTSRVEAEARSYNFVNADDSVDWDAYNAWVAQN